jgi:hypothetical protein
MAAAKRAGTCAERVLLGRLRQPKTHVNVAAMASAKTVHASSLGIQGTRVNSSRSRFRTGQTTATLASGGIAGTGVLPSIGRGVPTARGINRTQKRVDLRVTGNGSRPDQLNECPALSVNGAGWRGPGYIPWLRPDRPAMSLFDERVRAPAAPLARPAARLVEAATSKHRHHIFRLGSRRMLACLVR